MCCDPIRLSVYEAPCSLALAPRYTGRRFYRRGESFQQRKSVEAVWFLAVHELKWLYRNPIATLLDPAPINKPRPASLFGETSLYDLYHRALPRLSSVTESIGSRRNQ